MGDLVSLAEFRQQNRESRPVARTTKDVAYSELQRLDTELFGQQRIGLSFLELIIAENEYEEGKAMPVSQACDQYSIDMCGTKYLKFDRYDPEKYESFLAAALTYLYKFEPGRHRLRERVVSVAMHFYRHEEGLPSLAEPEDVADCNRNWWQRRSYRKKERRVEKKVLKFRDEAMLSARNYQLPELKESEK